MVFKTITHQKAYPLICLLLLIGIFHPIPSLFAQCGNNEGLLQIDITPDANFVTDNTRWEIRYSNGNVYTSGTTGTSLCVPANECFDFVLLDDFGNGLGNNPPGAYSIFYNNNLVTSGINFGSEEITPFGQCPAGSSCHFPIVLNGTGSNQASGSDTWYEFTPASTGRYEISTCNQGNSCNTTVWVYDRCMGLTGDESQEEATIYNDDFCGDQALATGILTAGVTYYIRIGDSGTSCAGQNINWTLGFLGAVTGCMDITACNYDPLATQDDGSCIYTGNANCPDGPDLIVLDNVIRNSIYVENRNNNDACYIAEGCMQGYGNRQIVRFTTHIRNIGNQDYYIGATPSNPNAETDQWEWDECHNHWHYEGYAEYLLYDDSGNALPVGFKNGFCVIDLECSGGGVAKYTCSNQGITAGCGDIYNSGLACQWIDVTDVPEGNYQLVVRVNWDRSPDALGRHEVNYENNWAQVCFNLSRSGGNASINLLNSCDPYTDCLGQVQGPAKPDCAGVCNGTAISGDLNNNLNYDPNDILYYLDGILDEELGTGPCYDLTSDNQITMEDPVWLMDCILSQAGVDGHQGHAHTCELPTNGIDNFAQQAIFTLGAANEANQYFDIYLENPYAHVMAFNLQLSGVAISSLESLVEDPNYDATLRFDASGEILGFSYTEAYSPRYGSATPFLRVYYSSLTNNLACITDVISVVNNFQEEVAGEVGSVACSDGIPDPCAESCEELTLTINLDRYPEETSWAIFNSSGVQVQGGGTYPNEPDLSTLTINMCLSDDNYEFNIYDSYGDGICCGYGNGSYSLVRNDGNEVLASGGNFDASETTAFSITGAGGGDSDNDGVCDAGDICPDGDDTIDTDGDNIPDACDSCPLSATGDSDNDGVCDNEDVCPNGDDTIDTDNDNIPDACDACTGSQGVDSDNDGVCDEEDICPGFNDNLIGTPCDDGDDCTIGEVYDNSCGCSGGVYTDEDADGYCVGDDPDDSNACVPDPLNGACEPCSIVDSNDFETGWGNWNDGGGDCTRVNNSTYSFSGDYTIRLRDNSGVASSMFTNPLDLSAATEVKLNFSFIANSMEANEDFFVEASSDGGNNFVIVQEWNSGVELTNGQTYTVSVDIPSASFSSNAVLRIRCDASGNGDEVFVDDVSIEVCTTPTCTVGTPCDDGDACTTGETLDSDCNCIGGVYVDADNDGYCVGDDPDDGDACNPDPNNENCVINGCVTVSSTDFESGLEDWSTVGTNASLATEASYANSGTNTLLIVNDGSQSVATSVELDVSSAISLQIDFSYITNSFEDLEDFWLQISTDGGSSFTTMQTWVLGTDFQNNIRQNESVIVYGPFSPNTKIRFRNDASASTDYLYIDDIVLTACGAEVDNQAPTAAISANPANGTAPLIVTFDGAGSNDPDGDNLGYNWNFGDGTTAMGQQVSHTYTTNGTYTATLTVTDGQYSNQASMQIVVDPATDGCTTLNSESFESGWGIWDGGTAASRANTIAFANSGMYSALIVNDGNQSVISSASYDLSSYVTLIVDFSFMTNSFEAGEDFWLQISTDGGSTYSTIQTWMVETDFDNNVRYNESVTITGPFSTTTKVRFRGDASADSDYLYLDDIVLTACVPTGTNEPPIASFTADPSTGTAPLAVSVDASTSADLDGNALSYSWDFGDGTTASGVTANHVYTMNGTYTIVLMVSDGQATDQASATITVEPGGDGCLTYNSENFETDLGIWNTGLAANRLNNSSYANSGSHSVLIVNDGSQSTIITNNLNLVDYGRLEVSFSYITNSFEAGEDFWLQVSTDGGSTYSTVKDWVVETDFQNNVREQEVVVISGPFTNTTKIRFRSDASADTDYLYLDDIVLTACTGTPLLFDGPSTVLNAREVVKPGIQGLFPNPTREKITVVFNKAVNGQLMIYDLFGNQLKRYDIEESVIEKVNVFDLTAGTYILQFISDGKEMENRKFIKID